MINVALANVRDPEWFHELWTNRYLTTGNSRDPIYNLRAVLPADNNILYKGRSVSAPQRLLELAHRNGLRLLRLVNTLLDFSRIEAGRAQALFEPTDLLPLTMELASVFRGATERAGLKLTVECATRCELVYLDREMWEKIVLNLVSNALKFTFKGEIAITLRQVNRTAEMRVRDTGVGIPAEEIPRLFERFHRVPNVRSRTHEGSGIGLALVQELVKQHGGSVSVESKLGEGSTFVVRLPLGSAHLPPEHLGGGRALGPTSGAASPFVEEALSWLPDSASENAEPLPREKSLPVRYPASEADASLSRLLIADDNADMREYLAHLLGERYRVETVPDGEAALAATRARRPDLILSDIMMPRLDGIGLLRELRADAALQTIPVILLSARAGEEVVESLQEGPDDYLIKPFSARELLARVAAHMKLARLRKESEKAIRESEERFRAFINATSDAVYSMSPDWTQMRYLQGREFIADTLEPSRTWLDI